MTTKYTKDHEWVRHGRRCRHRRHHRLRRRAAIGRCRLRRSFRPSRQENGQAAVTASRWSRASRRPPRFTPPSHGRGRRGQQPRLEERARHGQRGFGNRQGLVRSSSSVADPAKFEALMGSCPKRIIEAYPEATISVTRSSPSPSAERWREVDRRPRTARSVEPGMEGAKPLTWRHCPFSLHQPLFGLRSRRSGPPPAAARGR